jgi:hypothetical protein
MGWEEKYGILRAARSLRGLGDGWRDGGVVCGGGDGDDGGVMSPCKPGDVCGRRVRHGGEGL